MADQRKALTDTTELTDTVNFVHPTGIRTLNQDIIEEMYDMKNLINNNLKQIRRYQDDLRLDMND